MRKRGWLKTLFVFEGLALWYLLEEEER